MPAASRRASHTSSSPFQASGVPGNLGRLTRGDRMHACVGRVCAGVHSESRGLPPLQSQKESACDPRAVVPAEPWRILHAAVC